MSRVIAPGRTGDRGPAPLGNGSAPIVLADRIQREQAETLLETNQSFSISGFLLALAFGAIFFWTLRAPEILLWLLLMNLSQMARSVFLNRYARLSTARRDPERAVLWLCTGITLTSTGWGLAPWLFLPANDVALMSLMMIVLLGVASGGIASVAPYGRAVYCLVVPVMAGLATAMFWLGGIIHVFLGLCAMAYMAVCLKFGMQQNRLLGDALRARYEKEDLAHRLAEQVAMVERASLEKTRFFAAASHDLRQPLHSLGLFGETLLARLKGTPDEVLARNLVYCVDALDVSFSAMLEVSKLDAGVVEVQASPVAVGDLFRRLQSIFGTQADARGLSLRFSPGHKWVLADGALLDRLLGNLVDNALKFTHQGGVVVLARTCGAGVSLQVWDSGPGMHPDELPRIFDEFYQLGNLERDRSKGLGMGLAIVRRLSALMDLSLQVLSRPGRGTVFKLLVPCAQQPCPVATQTAPSMARLQPSLVGLKVLIVDDEENVRTSTADALRLYGIQVEVADDLHHARDIALRLEHGGQRLDALITDFRLRNGENGVGLVTALRAELGRPLAALLVTGDTAPERVLQARKSGIRALYKPVKVQDLVEELRVQMMEQPTG